jgi:hypothetical protein
MKKLSILLAPLMVGAMALSAAAQGTKVDTDPKSTDTAKVTVSGGLDIDWVFRDRALTAARGPYSAIAAGDNRSDEGVFHGHFKVRLDADLSDKVRVTIELDNKRYETATAAPSVDILGTNPEGQTATVREAQITIHELLIAGMQGTLGTHGYSFDVRGNGQATFFDPDHSGGTWQSLANEYINGGLNFSQGFFDELRPAGAHLRYSQEMWMANLILLPATIEGGASKADETNYGLDLWYLFKER